MNSRLALLGPPITIRHVLVRTCFWWVSARLFLYFFWNHALFDDLPFAVSTAIVVAIAVRTGLHVDRQNLFLANLGVDIRVLTAAVACVVFGVELAIFLLVRLPGA